MYWPRIQEEISRFIIECMIYYINKISNMGQGLYNPLPIPTHPWESISMDFVGRLPSTKKGHEYMFVVAYRFTKMCALMVH